MSCVQQIHLIGNSKVFIELSHWDSICSYKLQSNFETFFFSFSRSSFSLEYGPIVMESNFAEPKLVTIGFDLLFGLAVKKIGVLWMNMVTLCSQQIEMSPS